MSGVDADLIRFYSQIEAIDLPVIIGGSIATAIWGEPRATLDIDLIVAAEADDADRLVAAFPAERYYDTPGGGGAQGIEIGQPRRLQYH